MALAPLPTSVMSAKEKKSGVLPYPAFESGHSPMAQRSKGTINPLLHVQNQAEMLQTASVHVPVEPQQEVVNQASAEEMRMKELENMLNEAQSRAAVIEQEAYDKAYAAGEKAGLVLGEKRAEQMLEAMDHIVQQAEQQLQQLQQASGQAVVDIAQAITEHVIGAFGDDIDTALTLAAKQAAEQFMSEHTELESLLLVVHPDDLDVMSRMVEKHAEWRIRADKSVESGTCKLMSAHQDALIDLKQAIQKAVSHIQGQLLAEHG